MPKKIFFGFKNKEQLREHIREQFPKCKVESIKKLKSAKPATKFARSFTQHSVKLKKCK